MDANNNANFINSVAAGQTVPCPTCHAVNQADSTNCRVCGGSMSNNAPAFASVAETVPVSNEDVSAFANGLPAWDIVPPQVVVRRR